VKNCGLPDVLRDTFRMPDYPSPSCFNEAVSSGPRLDATAKLISRPYPTSGWSLLLRHINTIYIGTLAFGGQCVVQSYGKGEPVIADVSLELASDETITIVGPSGAGKTTLLYMLCGLVPPDHGSVKLDANRCKVVPPRSPSFFRIMSAPWKTVLENVTLGLKIQGWAGRSAGSRSGDLAELGLAGRDHDYSAQLSVASSNVWPLQGFGTQPKLFLMDEPFSSLDASPAKAPARIAGDLEKQPHPLCFGNHSVPEAVLLGRRILIFAGKPASIVSSFDNPGFGVPEYRHQEAFYELIRTVRHRMEHYCRKYAQNSRALCCRDPGDGLLWKLLRGAIHSVLRHRNKRWPVLVWRAHRVFWYHFWASTLRVLQRWLLPGWWLSQWHSFGKPAADRRLDRAFIFITYPIPKIVLLPVVLILFGLGDLSR